MKHSGDMSLECCVLEGGKHGGGALECDGYVESCQALGECKGTMQGKGMACYSNLNAIM